MFLPSKSSVLGIVAISLWSLSFTLSRSLATEMGTIAAAAAVCLSAGLVGGIFTHIAGRHRRPLDELGVGRITVLGALFAGYQISIFLALGLAGNHEAFLAVTVINYLWPGLTLVLSVPILNRGWKKSLIAGMVMVFAGISLGVLSGNIQSVPVFADGIRDNIVPYLLALLAALSWAVYSNLVNKWARDAGSGLVPFYFLAAGAILSLFAWNDAANVVWSYRVASELIVLSVVVMLGGYVCWDISMRSRTTDFIPALANIIPIPSILISGLYIGIALSWRIIAACVLVVAGTMVSRYSTFVRAEKSDAAHGM